MIPEVTVKFAFILSRKLGKSQAVIQGKRFAEIISSLKEQLKDKFSEFVSEDGIFKYPYVFILNGEVISKEELLKIEFKDKDILQFILPLAGGSRWQREK